MVQIYLDKLTAHRSGSFRTHCLLGWGFVPQLHKTLVSLWPTTDFWGFFLRAPENLGLVNCRPTTSTGLPLMGPWVNVPDEWRLWRVSWIGKCLTVGVSLPSIFAVSLGLPEMPITWGGLPALLALYWVILCRCLYNGVNVPRGFIFIRHLHTHPHTLWGNKSLPAQPLRVEGIHNNGVLPGAARELFMILPSPPQSHAVLGTMPNTLA